MNFRSKFKRKHFSENYLAAHFRGSPKLQRLAKKHPKLVSFGMKALKLNPVYQFSRIFKKRRR